MSDRIVVNSGTPSVSTDMGSSESLSVVGPEQL